VTREEVAGWERGGFQAVLDEVPVDDLQEPVLVEPQVVVGLVVRRKPKLLPGPVEVGEAVREGLDTKVVAARAQHSRNLCQGKLLVGPVHQVDQAALRYHKVEPAVGKRHRLDVAPHELAALDAPAPRELQHLGRVLEAGQLDVRHAIAKGCEQVAVPRSDLEKVPHRRSALQVRGKAQHGVDLTSAGDLVAHGRGRVGAEGLRLLAIVLADRLTVGSSTLVSRRLGHGCAA
jgi:hypothetical protein